MAWYNEMGNESDTVLSSRIRFARNLSGYPFDGKLTEADAKEIIENHGGTITMESKFGEYTKVTIKLPPNGGKEENG